MRVLNLAARYLLASRYMNGEIRRFSDGSGEHAIWHCKPGIGKPKYPHEELGDGVVDFMEKIENYGSASAVPRSIR